MTTITHAGTIGYNNAGLQSKIETEASRLWTYSSYQNSEFHTSSHMSYFHPTVGMQHSTLHLASCPPSTPTPQTVSLSLSLYHLADDSFLSLHFAGCSLGHLKAMSFYCKKIITFIFRTRHYIYFFHCWLEISTDDKMYSEISHYTHKAWELLCNEYGEDMSPRHISWQYPRTDSTALYIRTKRLTISGLSSVTDACVATLTSGWLRTFVLHPHTAVETQQTSRWLRQTEPTEPNGTASGFEF